MHSNKPARALILSPQDSDLAGIEYCGIAGGSHDCQAAVERLIQFGDQISKARILTYERDHCLLLTTHIGDLIAIKSGFSSGYGGEGPRRFSYVLRLLDVFDVEIEEYKVSEKLIERVDFCALTMPDLSDLDTQKPIRPTRWRQYIDEFDYDRSEKGTLLHELPHVMPFAIIDARIMDLAVSFFRTPDANLLTAYRRLEDTVRLRTSITEVGSRLFSKAFSGESPSLRWDQIDEAEKAGRLSLFIYRSIHGSSKSTSASRA
jgi:hypothetical protein